jgi:hypothetical protein
LMENERESQYEEVISFVLDDTKRSVPHDDRCTNRTGPGSEWRCSALLVLPTDLPLPVRFAVGLAPASVMLPHLQCTHTALCLSPCRPHRRTHGLVVNILISTPPALHACAHHGAPTLFPTGEPRRAHRDSRRRHLYDHDGATHTPNDGAINTSMINSVSSQSHHQIRCRCCRHASS